MTSTAADVPLIINSGTFNSERRINPSWTISQFKARLEPITGIPAGSQRLALKIASQPQQAIEAHDETTQQLGHWPLQPYAEILVGMSTSALCHSLPDRGVSLTSQL